VFIVKEWESRGTRFWSGWGESTWTAPCSCVVVVTLRTI